MILIKEGNSMGKNPVVPYILIFSLGIVLIFFMSLYGLEQKKEIAGEGKTDEVTEVAEFDVDVALGKCISCHGGELEGTTMAPSLHGLNLSKDELKDIIKNGIPDTIMPGGLIPDDHLDQMADYILSLK
jgi:cytochrome c550